MQALDLNTDASIDVGILRDLEEVRVAYREHDEKGGAVLRRVEGGSRSLLRAVEAA
jgi:hypothetical protein